MNTSQNYIPNPQKWTQFYKGFVSGHHNSYNMPPSYSNQHGGSITASPSSFMIPIEDKRDQDSSHQKKKVNRNQSRTAGRRASKVDSPTTEPTSI